MNVYPYAYMINTILLDMKNKNMMVQPKPCLIDQMKIFSSECTHILLLPTLLLNQNRTNHPQSLQGTDTHRARWMECA